MFEPSTYLHCSSIQERKVKNILYNKCIIFYAEKDIGRCVRVFKRTTFNKRLRDF